MLAETSITGHVERYHISNGITSDLNRLIRNDMTAASSFRSEKDAEILIQATVKENDNRLKCWLANAAANELLPLNSTFTKNKAYQLGVTPYQTGVAIDPVTNRIHARTTRSVTVVLIRKDTERGWSIYTAFPNVSDKYGTNSNQDLIALLPMCQAYRAMPDIAKACIIERCRPGSWKLAYDLASSSIELDIVEKGEMLGRVAVSLTASTWLPKLHEPSLKLTRGVGAWIMERAFPETCRKVESLRRTIDMVEANIAAPIAIETEDVPETTPEQPPVQEAPKTEPAPEEKPVENEAAETKDDMSEDEERRERAALRAAKRAKRRSKAANGGNNTKRKKKENRTKKRNRDKAQAETRTPFKLTKVMTKYEREGLTQHEQNIQFLLSCLDHSIPIINESRLEMIFVCCPEGSSREIRRLAGIRLATIEKDTLDEIMAEWDKKNHESYQNVHIPHIILDIQDCMTDVMSIYGPNDESGTFRSIDLSTIADDAAWQPLIAPKLTTWLDTRCVDNYGRPIRRVCEEAHDISIIETLSLTLGEYDETAKTLIENAETYTVNFKKRLSKSADEKLIKQISEETASPLTPEDVKNILRNSNKPFGLKSIRPSHAINNGINML